MRSQPNSAELVLKPPNLQSKTMMTSVIPRNAETFGLGFRERNKTKGTNQKKKKSGELCPHEIKKKKKGPRLRLFRLGFHDYGRARFASYSTVNFL